MGSKDFGTCPLSLTKGSETGRKQYQNKKQFLPPQTTYCPEEVNNQPNTSQPVKKQKKNKINGSQQIPKHKKQIPLHQSNKILPYNRSNGRNMTKPGVRDTKKTIKGKKTPPKKKKKKKKKKK